MTPHFCLGRSSLLRDLFSRVDQQRQPPSRQPVAHHHDHRHFGHPLFGCGRACVHLPAGLARPGLHHCGRSHLHLHSGYQLHAVCAPGEKTLMHARKYKTVSGGRFWFLPYLFLWITLIFKGGTTREGDFIFQEQLSYIHRIPCLETSRKSDGQKSRYVISVI